MSEWTGYYVVSFHLFPEKGMTRPFEAKIIGDLGNYWKLQAGRKVVTANKGACSAVPYKDTEHKRSQEYRTQVEKTLGRSLDRPVLNGPGITPKAVPESAPRAKAKAEPKAKAKAKAKAEPGAEPGAKKPFGDLLDF